VPATAEDTFYIQIPPDWTVKIRKATRIIFEKEPGVVIDVWKIRTDLTDAEDAAQRVFKEWSLESPHFKVLSSYTRELGGVKSVHYHIQEGTGRDATFSLGDILLYDGKIYVVKCTAPLEKFETYSPIFSNILDTIHF
jgi:hypothetical protein